MQRIHFHQQGVILPVALVALLVIMIASVGLIRSTDTSTQVAGNLAFKQDAANQGERAALVVQDLFASGALSTIASREADLVASNYYATIQPSHQTGLPAVLMDLDQFDGLFATNNIVDANSQITVRYLVERLCYSVGDVTTSNCVTSTLNSDLGGDAMNLGNQGKASGSDSPVYRLSIRVTGPLNTNAFLQREYSF